MKNGVISSIVLTLFLCSCDVNYFLFVRNYKQEPVKINVSYFDEEFLSKRLYLNYTVRQDSICYIDEIVDDQKISNVLAKCDGYIDLECLDSNSYHTYLPGKSTVLVKPVLIAFCVNRVIINDSDRNDTIIFWGKGKNYKDYIEKGRLNIKGFFLFRNIYIMDVK